jgi:hypothetical protein
MKLKNKWVCKMIMANHSIGLLIHPSGEKEFVSYDTPKDVYKHKMYTICGSLLEEGLVLIQQENKFYDYKIEEKIENINPYFFPFNKDDVLYGPVLVIRTDNSGEPIDI